MSKNSKRISIGVLALGLLCMGVSVPSQVDAAKTKTQKIKLSQTKLTMTVGKTKTLKVKGTPAKLAKKVKWKSSNKKIAVIKSTKGTKKQKATILAKKKGNCTITAKVGKKKLKCKVKVTSAVTTPAPTYAVTKGAIGVYVTSATASPSAMTINVKFYNGMLKESSKKDEPCATWGYGCTLDRWNGSQWVRVDVIGLRGVPAILCALGSQKTADFTYKYYDPVESFTPGLYRIHTSLAAPQGGQLVNSSAEFICTEVSRH